MIDEKKEATQAKYIENLQDAGCDEKTINCFLVCGKNGGIQQQMKLLSTYRCKLLVQVHEAERCIDCLDYLVYKLHKENE